MGLSATAPGLSKMPSTSAITGASSTAPMVEPHVGQNARLDVPEDRQRAGAPPGPVQRTASLGNSTHATVNAPEWRWHIVQEQVCGNSAGPTASNRMSPHKQPPVYVFGTALPFTPCHPNSLYVRRARILQNSGKGNCNFLAHFLSRKCSALNARSGY